MGTDGSRSVPRPEGEHVCPSCGRQVGTAVKRRKVLGVFVPVWGPAPCHNPACDACVTEEQSEDRGRRGHKSRRRGAPPQKARPRAPGPAEADTKSVVETEPDPGA
ncbi:hypothetical protein [Streptomyces sp. MNP-20]|uniref:hypothetical protein n=1 Tax=Streptomyces sp. MNP-20 TaxID=2721165 RepID=UPI0015564E5B|nr:hypothetical protein [Streptomyces sp. MNP-20]